MTTVLQDKDNAFFNVLYIAFELSNSKWKLGFSNGEKIRIKTIEAGDWSALLSEIALAKTKLGCSESCRILSCYEAGRDGFWIHRALTNEGIVNYVIDSSSIEVSRRKKQIKTDKVDVQALLRLLIRYNGGETQAMRAINVPTVKAEDERRLIRERERLIKERGAHSTRIKSLLVLHGIKLDKISNLPSLLPNLEAHIVGYKLPADLKNELQREFERYQLAAKQIKELELQQQQRVSEALKGSSEEKIKQLMLLKAVGWQSSWYLVSEFFGWRAFKNAKQVGSCAGLAPTPYDSGDSQREQGISKAGNKRIRRVMVELSWLWLRYQPNSDISQWFEKRFAQGGKRMRRIGIVAMARKLLVSLWRYLELGEMPSGAQLS